jgi:outer membrane protein assembly factor BamE (lipoprotein component of BamABCDE complex)
MRSLIVLGLLALFALPGCQSPAPEAPADKLTVGTVQREIKVGLSSGAVAEILGSPNIVTTDDQRREQWIYDKISSQRVDTENSFGGSIIILGGNTSSRERSTTQRTLTVIIKFDHDSKVRDFAYNYSQF